MSTTRSGTVTRLTPMPYVSADDMPVVHDLRPTEAEFTRKEKP